jgi:hypothetical protein
VVEFGNEARECATGWEVTGDAGSAGKGGEVAGTAIVVDRCSLPKLAFCFFDGAKDGWPE